MKFPGQNTLVRDFVEAAICLIVAAVLLVMYSGCAEEAGRTLAHDGGYTEETSSLDSITIAGMANNTVLRKVSASVEDSATVIQNYNVNVAAKKGTIVTAFELDSITLDTTGRFFVDTVFNDSGSFSFENVSLNSPYVMIRVQDSCLSGPNRADFASENTERVEICRTLNAIADVRKTKDIGVTLMTHIKSFKLLELVAAGVPFATANKQAEQEVLESFGVYENLENFESLSSSARLELSFLNQLAAEYPLSFLELDQNTSCWFFINNLGFVDEFEFLAYDYSQSLLNDSTSQSFVEWLKGYFSGYSIFSDDVAMDLSSEMYRVQYFSYIPLAAVSSSQERLQLYTETLKLIEYELNYLAKRAGLERCTAQREGEVEHRENADFVCRSGKWHHGYKWIDHTNGTMVDNRDGKTYNTVTYNIGGKQQTWMAENLNYEGLSMSADSALNANLKGSTGCYAGGEESCVANGRMYEWRAAMSFDEKALKVFMKDSADTLLLEDMCKYRFDDYGRCYLQKTSECSNAYARVQRVCSDLYGGASWIGFWDWNYTELMDGADPNNYQGVCPDGWRLPTAKDWKNLAQFVVDQYGSDSVDAGMVLFDDGATGFGVKKIVQMDENAGNLRIRVLGNPMFAAIPDFETMPHTFTFSDLLFVHRGAMSIMFDSEDKQYLNMQDAPIYNYDFAYEPYFIRCVKD